jgi:hypothetical protein
MLQWLDGARTPPECRITCIRQTQNLTFDVFLNYFFLNQVFCIPQALVFGEINDARAQCYKSFAAVTCQFLFEGKVCALYRPF